MYDSVMVPCPKCGTRIEFQSKSGDCSLTDYALEEAPGEVLHGIRGDAHECPTCRVVVGVDLHVTASVVMTNDPGTDSWISALRVRLDAMTAAERIGLFGSVFGEFCRDCGAKTRGCACNNDE
jgi:hypothetical protein